MRKAFSSSWAMQATTPSTWIPRALTSLQQAGWRTGRLASVLAETWRHSQMVQEIGPCDENQRLSELSRIASSYTARIFDLFNIEVEWRGALPETSPTLFVGNHISYFDIPVLLARVPAAFVAKAEVRRMPIIGASAAKCGTILVKRQSAASRQDAAAAIASCLQERRQSVAIFPSGTTSLTESKPWRHGPFTIAQKAEVPVQAFRLRYDPMRAVAYIDDDFIMTHMWRLLGMSHRLGRPLRVVVEFAPPCLITDPVRQAEDMHQWTQEFLVR